VAEVRFLPFPHIQPGNIYTMLRPIPSSSAKMVDEIVQTAWTYLALDQGLKTVEAMQRDTDVKEWFEGGIAWGIAATHDVLQSYGLVNEPHD
jgi:RPA family protein